MRSIFNKIKYSLLATFGIFSLLPIVFAAYTNGQIPNPLGDNVTLGDIIARFIPFVPVVVGLVLFGVLTWGGMQVVLAGPNEEAKKKGFQTIQNAITGVVLLFVSVGIITLIEAIFGVKILFGVFVR